MKRIMRSVLMLGFAGVVSMLMFGLDAKAYIDPSVTSYIIQAVAGLIVAVGAVVGIYLRKTRKKINEKLGVDENRNKEVETDDIMEDGQQ